MIYSASVVTRKSSSISATGTESTSLCFIRAALKTTTSGALPSNSASICSRTEGMEERSLRSRRRVDTFADAEEAWDCTKAASDWRRVVLRERRTAWVKPLERKDAAMWFPIPGPAPRIRIVREGEDISLVV